MNENLKLSHLAKSEKNKNVKKKFIELDLKTSKNNDLLLEEKMDNIQKSIKELRTKFKSTKKKKNLFQKYFFTAESTPKKKI